MQTSMTQFLKRTAIVETVSSGSSTATVVAVESFSSKRAHLSSTTTAAAPPAVSLESPARLWVDREIDLIQDDKWKSVLQQEATKPYARKMIEALSKISPQKILPPIPMVFNAFKYCPFENVRVVILGQDPYHGTNQAHGLCFSVQKGVPPPPSLKNIFKEAAQDVKLKIPSHGCLEGWAKQGVLMLNALLTVENGTPMAHKDVGWETFTDAAVQALSKDRENLVFMLWGKPAQMKGKVVDRSKHLVITSSHPSPLGAMKTAEPFLGSHCFSRCNTYLKENGKAEIDWNRL